MSTDDPIIDTRLPTFAKGQWFGPVPQRRVRISYGNLAADWDVLLPGVVIPFSHTVGEDANQLECYWRGLLSIDGGEYEAVYDWLAVNPVNGSAAWSHRIRQLDGDREIAFFAFGTRPIIGGPLAMSQVFVNPPNTSTASCVKHPLPGWSTPSEYFPGILLAEAP